MAGALKKVELPRACQRENQLIEKKEGVMICSTQDYADSTPGAICS